MDLPFARLLPLSMALLLLGACPSPRATPKGDGGLDSSASGGRGIGGNAGRIAGGSGGGGGGGMTGEAGDIGRGGSGGPGGSVAATGGSPAVDAGPPGPDGAVACAADQKLCNGMCVAISDPKHGCDATLCSAASCPNVAGATLVCRNGMCVVGTCGAGTMNCAGRCVAVTDPAYGCGGTVPVADASDDHAEAADAMADSGQPGVCPALDFNVLCGCAVDGKIQCDGTCSTEDTTCVPTGQFYVLTNLLLGDGRPLDTYGPPGMEAFMATQPGTSGQHWSITASPDGTFRLANMAAGPTLSLESSPDGKKLFMATSNDSPAQKWQIRSLGNVSVRRFRILNVLVGTTRSLDTPTAVPNSPFLNMNGDFSGEFWKLTKAP